MTVRQNDGERRRKGKGAVATPGVERETRERSTEKMRE